MAWWLLVLLWGKKKLYSSILKVYARCCDEVNKNLQLEFFVVIKS